MGVAVNITYVNNCDYIMKRRTEDDVCSLSNLNTSSTEGTIREKTSQCPSVFLHDTKSHTY